MRRMLKRSSLVAVAVCLMLGPASAGPITTFDASGTFTDGSSLGGTVTIDVGSGQVLSALLTSTGLSNYTFSADVSVTENYPVAGDATIEVDAAGGGFPVLLLTVATPDLVGYSGGAIESITQQTNGYFSDIAFADNSFLGLAQGDLTPEMATPEPSTLISTFVAGIAGIGYYLHRRRAA